MNAKKRILIVDDDLDFVDSCRTVLEAGGFEVGDAVNGEECMEKLRAGLPDLIVLDVMMARRDEGFDVSRELRNSEVTKAIPILMVTSINSEMNFRFAPDETWLPVDAFLEKPVPAERLLEEVERLLGG